jgi:hypothetical protein
MERAWVFREEGRDEKRAGVRGEVMDGERW